MSSLEPFKSSLVCIIFVLWDVHAYRINLSHIKTFQWPMCWIIRGQHRRHLRPGRFQSKHVTFVLLLCIVMVRCSHVKCAIFANILRNKSKPRINAYASMRKNRSDNASPVCRAYLSWFVRNEGVWSQKSARRSRMHPNGFWGTIYVYYMIVC